MTLALKMGRTLEELGRTMSSAEFSLWLDCYGEDLWGEMREYERAGIIAASIANWAGKTLRTGAQPLAPSDFMPIPRAPEEEAGEPDPLEHFRMVAAGAAHG